MVDWGGEGSAEQRSAPTTKPQFPQLPNYRIFKSDAEAPMPGFTEIVPETKKAAVTRGYRWSVEGRYGWVGGTRHRMDAVAEPYLIGIWQFRCREPAWAAV